MSNLIRHAETELARAGLFDPDSDYNGMVGNAVMDLIKLFSEQGHSGFSAATVTRLFAQLSRFEPLSPLTDDPAEWRCVGLDDSREVYQNCRQSDAFSEDGGRTYYVLSEQRKWVHWPILNVITRLREPRWMYPIHTSVPTGFIIGVAE